MRLGIFAYADTAAVPWGGFLRCLFWAGIITALFRLFVIGVFL